MNGKIWRFISRELAIRFSERTIKPTAVMCGDDMRFWVVTMAQMEALLIQGYELAE